MMTERRYADDEVREIFKLATTGDTRDKSLPAETGGFTLDQLQRIGEEAGIDPVRVAQAAAKLDTRPKAAPVQRSFGMPVGVSRVIDLPRAPTDREWEQLVSLFRTTFGTQGKVTTTGGMRDWSQGELHISVEPTPHGEQLRLDPLIASALQDDWALSRLDSTVRAILRAGVFELLDRKDVPVAVIVTEYVEIARAFFDDDEPKLVNAVLDRIAKQVRSDQKK